MMLPLTSHLRVLRLELVPFVPLGVARYHKLERCAVLAGLLDCHDTLNVVRSSLPALKDVLRLVGLGHDLQKLV